MTFIANTETQLNNAAYTDCACMGEWPDFALFEISCTDNSDNTVTTPRRKKRPRCTADSLVPRPRPSEGGLGTLVVFLGILCVSNHVTHAYAHAHFSNKRVIRELRIVSCPGGGVWVAVTREFERDNCVISEILQSDWTIPNRAGVPRKSTKVPRPSFRVWAGRSGHETTRRR